ncbi:MAG: glycosyltransferase [Candidatus Altiarchaeales archaeon]|nr:glycosyltransferase [Candidatus Altiarchaeales archaeon]MBD3415522.1 glycosyltransferase [Candidatus Altiarchaeales archaeon]
MDSGSKSLKIALVYDMIYPYYVGGAELRNHELAKRLARDNEVHLLGVKLWDGPDVIERDGVFIHGVCRYSGGNSFSGARRAYEPMLFALGLLKPLLEGGYDVIDCSGFPYFHSYACKLASLVRGSKLAVTWHQCYMDYWPTYLGPYRGFIAIVLEKTMRFLSRYHIAVSDKTKSDVVALGVRPDGVFVSHNGVDTKVVGGSHPSAGEYDIVFVGRLIHQKNLPLLLDAVKILAEDLPDLRVCIVGDGPDLEELIARRNEHGLSGTIDFRGVVEDRRELYSLLKSSRVFALPSLIEGFGIVVLEAFACGLPVVTVDSRWNAARELVDGAGLVAGRSPEDFAYAFKQLLGDEELRARMSAHALEKAADYSWDRIADELAAYYKSLVKSTTAP